MAKGKPLTLPVPARGIFNLFRAVLRQVRRWQQLHRERQALAALSDRALLDIGLHRYDVEDEARRPFWDDPLKR